MEILKKEEGSNSPEKSTSDLHQKVKTAENTDVKSEQKLERGSIITKTLSRIAPLETKGEIKAPFSA
jgi:hypothetical protein